MFHAGYIDP